MSKSYKAKALNDHGVYKVYSVTPANPSTDTAIIKIKSDKGNSKTFFNSPWVYYGETEINDCKIIAYSYDLKKWVNGSKLWLEPNKTVYIKLQFVCDGEPKSINYSGENGKSSFFEIDEEKVDYPKSHYKDEITGIECYFDLITHKGKVEIDAQDDF